MVAEPTTLQSGLCSRGHEGALDLGFRGCGLRFQGFKV